MPEQVYVIFEVADLNAYLKKSERKALAKICNKILVHRDLDGKVPNPVYQIKKQDYGCNDIDSTGLDEGGF